jgi:hypothetical protein
MDTAHEHGQQQQKATCCSSQGNRDVSPNSENKSVVVIKTMTDNITTVYNINRRATAHALLPSTRKLLVKAENCCLQVKADYIPGKENGTADSLSLLETEEIIRFNRRKHGVDSAISK